jgi:hypothetical protein
MGDFNLKEINWKTNDASTSENHMATLFLECIRDTYLFQHVKENTRFRENEESSLLDLVLTNEENMINNIQFLPSLGKSDHITLLFDFNCYIESVQSSTKKNNFFKGDYVSMCENLESLPWTELLEECDISRSWDTFAERIEELIEKYIPVSKVVVGGTRHNPFVDNSCLRAIKEKKKRWTKYLYCKSDINYERYKIARNNVIYELRTAKYHYEQDLANKIKTDSKLFWKYVKSKTKTKSVLNKMEMPSGDYTSTNQEVADILNNYFSSVFEIEGNEELPDFPHRNFDSELNNILISDKDIEQAIDKIKNSKSPGPDNIHPNLIKNCKKQLIKPLRIIFTKSLQQGGLPSIWKRANVTAIFKSGNNSKPENYRPISLTSVPGKLLERIIRNNIVAHMENNRLFTPYQHGFLKGKSCVTQLLEFLEDLTEMRDRGETVDIIYLDFCKAFDKVPHKRLLKKLYSYGIRGNVLNWVNDFLNDRIQRVIVNGEKSDWRNVTSGIPQGSVLGPILFLVFINDLPDQLDCLIKLFADDAKLYSIVQTPEHASNLQRNLTMAEDWALRWKMYFNHKKCKHLPIGSKSIESTYTMHHNGEIHTLEQVEKEKDLGVIIDNKLSFSDHISEKVSKGNRNLGIIFRTFTFIDKNMFLTLYKALVRPHVEYATSVWSPNYKKYKIALENVQRRATRLVYGFRHLPYPERLRQLGLPSLEYRRERADLIQVYKIINNIDIIDKDKMFTLSNYNATRGNNLKLFKRRSRLSLRANVFGNRVVETWNSLPNEVIFVPSVNAFKK